MGIGICNEVQITYIACCQWNVGYICYPEPGWLLWVRSLLYDFSIYDNDDLSLLYDEVWAWEALNLYDVRD